MTLHPLGVTDGTVVAELVRDQVVESLHLGVVAVAERSGKLLLSKGDTEAVVFPRSTLKPLQALAMLSTGVDFTPLELALSTASHCGSRQHREAITALLHHHDVGPEHLQCPKDWPLGSAQRAELLAEGGQPSRLAMNCSGKHAGFLATCQHSEWDLGSYLSASHPLQSLILETIGDYAAETPSFSSVDGCGSPLHALSVGALARAFARVGAGETAHEQQLLHAVKDNSWALDGEGRDNTVTIDTIGGIAKIGAEGLVAMTTPEGVGVAVKILDGSMRATTLVALSALASVGAISDRAHTGLAEVLAVPVTGGEATIGGLRATI